jgi:hypothetical protein
VEPERIEEELVGSLIEKSSKSNKLEKRLSRKGSQRLRWFKLRLFVFYCIDSNEDTSFEIN